LHEDKHGKEMTAEKDDDVVDFPQDLSADEESTNQSNHEELADQKYYNDAAEVLEGIVQFAEAACQ